MLPAVFRKEDTGLLVCPKASNISLLGNVGAEKKKKKPKPNQLSTE